MFKLVIGFMLLIPALSFASIESENINIKEIKSWLKKNGTESTCVDEYLSRRKQLGWQLGLTPVAIAGSFAGGAIGGGLAGHGIFLISGQSNMMYADLGYTVGGAFLGAVAGAAVGVTSGTTSTIQFFNNQRLIKVIWESTSGSNEDYNSKILHEKYIDRYPEDNVSIQEFKDTIAKLDLTGELCDGSIVEPKRFKKGKKLKQRLANKTEIFKNIHEKLVK